MRTERMRLILLVLLWLPLAALAGPKIQSWQTSNGARVLFVAAPDLPMVDVRVVFDAGSARDGELAGLAQLTNGLLIEGAGEWDATELAERFENVGARYSSDSLRDMGVVSLRSLTEPAALDTAIDTFATVLARPQFTETALQRDLNAMRVALRQAEQRPGSIASEAFYQALYGAHPYAHKPEGSKQALERISRADVRNFHSRYYVAANAVIAIVGALDRAQAEQLAERVLAGLPRGEAAPPLPPVSALTKAVDVRKEFPSSQSHIFIGQPALTRDDPDYFPLYVGNHVLGGGGLVSQLSDQVREKRGLAYSVYSYFLPMRGPGPFMMGAQTKNAKAGETLQVMRETLARFIENGPTAEELKRSKQNITGGFPLRIASNSKIVEYLAMIGFYDRPLDYLDTFVGKVEAVTAEQIRDAFQRRLQPQKMVTVMVGGAGQTAASH